MPGENDGQTGESTRHQPKARPRGARPWERRPDEPPTAYAAFLTYRDLPPGQRSIDAAYKASRDEAQDGGKVAAKRRASGQFFAYASKHDWVERTEAWDAHLQSARDRATVDQAVKWERRRLEAIEKTWNLADDLAAKLDRMLAFPLASTRTEDDGKTIIIEPAGWSWSTVVALVRLVCELQNACLTAALRPTDEYSDRELAAIQDAYHECIAEGTEPA